MGKKKLGRILATGAAAAAAGVAAKKVYDTKKKKDEIQKEAVEEAVMKRRDYTGRTDGSFYRRRSGQPGRSRLSDKGLQIPRQPDYGL